MLKNLDLLASLIEKKKIRRTVCEHMPLNWKDIIRRATKITFKKKQILPTSTKTWIFPPKRSIARPRKEQTKAD